MNDRSHSLPESLTVGPGYPALQLAKALQAASDHEDPAARSRARAKADKWLRVISGMFDASLSVGSRTPVADTPAWLTVEVVTGGFATGGLMAGGPLLSFEEELLAPARDAKKPGGDIETDRTWLNLYFLSDDGLRCLSQQIETGCYEIAAPEEGALLVVAWLIQSGNTDTAKGLIDAITPYFHRVRFYPRPSSTPLSFGSKVFLRSVKCVTADLQAIEPNERILAQREAIHVWHPLYDRAVALFLGTVDGQPPCLSLDENVTPQVTGGSPDNQISADFLQEAQSILDDYAVARKNNQRCNRPRRKDNFAQLREFLAKAVAVRDGQFSSSDIARIRLLLARYMTKRGVPQSAETRQLRERQQQQAGGVLFSELADIAARRLKSYPPDSGIEDLSSVSQAITQPECERFDVPVGCAIPKTVLRKLQRCLKDTVDVLIEKQIIPSGDTLAEVLPQMTASLRAAGIHDESLRMLYAGIDQAFSKRRSLLLLNLESQVKLNELPWIQAIENFRGKSLSGQESALQAMKEIVRVALTAFPFAILPNKLLRELRGLAKTAKIDLPLVDELAADIFMGEFSGKFVDAAKTSGELLRGTLYERYYRIDYGAIAKLPSGKVTLRRNRSAFAKLCADRAGVSLGGWDVVSNGMAIEQQQILTTQNLAVLYARLDMHRQLSSHLPLMAEATLQWICRQLQIKTTDWHSRLIKVKNSAYAWRQMIFYLALMPTESAAEFCDWAQQHWQDQSAKFAARFQRAINDLTKSVHAADQASVTPFVGWAKEKHWLMNDE